MAFPKADAPWFMSLELIHTACVCPSHREGVGSCLLINPYVNTLRGPSVGDRPGLGTVGFTEPIKMFFIKRAHHLLYTRLKIHLISLKLVQNV